MSTIGIRQGPERKVALITGAGPGLGRATALRFADKGLSVVVTDSNHLAARETASLITDAGGEAVSIRFDSGNPADVEAMVNAAERAFGELHYAVNNVVNDPVYCLLHEINELGWNDIVDRTLKCIWLAMKHEIPAIKRSGGGAIVNVASLSGIESAPGMSAFGAAKAGVISLSKSAAAELAGDDIRVNCVTPGGIASEPVVALCESEPGLHGHLDNLHATGRLARPEEIANCIHFLCSDEASFMSGDNMVVDGGGAVMSKI